MKIANGFASNFSFLSSHTDSSTDARTVSAFNDMKFDLSQFMCYENFLHIISLDVFSLNPSKRTEKLEDFLFSSIQFERDVEFPRGDSVQSITSTT